WTRYEMLKHLVYLLTHPDGSTEPLVIALPGDREVDAKRLEAAVAPAIAAPFTDADFAEHPVLKKGYIGPEGLGLESASGIRYLVDPRVVPGTSWVAGAGEKDKHVYDLVFGRDFTADGTIEAAEVRDGDPAPDGSGPLRLTRGMEMGHIFQLGRKYAEALDLTVLDENGKTAVVTMGSYGIGVTRAVAAVAELYHDEKGLAWPRQLAPADVHIVATGKGQEVFEEAERIAAELEARGLEVLYDYRPKVSPGVKFKDSELLGVPTSVVVGRSLAQGVVELRDRAGGAIREISPHEIVDALGAEVRGACTAAARRGGRRWPPLLTGRRLVDLEARQRLPPVHQRPQALRVLERRRDRQRSALEGGGSDERDVVDEQPLGQQRRQPGGGLLVEGPAGDRVDRLAGHDGRAVLLGDLPELLGPLPVQCGEVQVLLPRRPLGPGGEHLVEVSRVPLLQLGPLDRAVVIGLGTDRGRIGRGHLPGGNQLLRGGGRGRPAG